MLVPVRVCAGDNRHSAVVSVDRDVVSTDVDIPDITRPEERRNLLASEIGPVAEGLQASDCSLLDFVRCGFGSDAIDHVSYLLLVTCYGEHETTGLMSRLQKNTEIFEHDSDQCLQAFAACQALRNLASNSDVLRTYSFPFRS